MRIHGNEHEKSTAGRREWKGEGGREGRGSGDGRKVSGSGK